jgi:phosphoribosyl 1,2-cyclic phosphate phosphodiesterase
MTQFITILGCGSSGGVPRLGAGWGECNPSNAKNRRRRCSILVERVDVSGQTSAVLVDTSPDIREQLLDNDVSHLDAVLYTHDHADHTHGIDDLRALVLHNRKRIDMWMSAQTRSILEQRFDYIFKTPEGGDYPPIANAHLLHPPEPLSIHGAGGMITVIPFDVVHGNITALGYRFGNVAYTPDVNNVPDESLESLRNLDVWIVDALRHKPHPSHFSAEEALAWIERMRPKRAILTNLHTDLDYDELRRQLPENVEPAYDGMRLVCNAQ